MVPSRLQSISCVRGWWTSTVGKDAASCMKLGQGGKGQQRRNKNRRFYKLPCNAKPPDLGLHLAMEYHPIWTSFPISALWNISALSGAGVQQKRQPSASVKDEVKSCSFFHISSSSNRIEIVHQMRPRNLWRSHCSCQRSLKANLNELMQGFYFVPILALNKRFWWRRTSQQWGHKTENAGSPL